MKTLLHHRTATKRNARIAGIIAIVVLVTACAFYIGTYYHASGEALSALSVSNDSVRIERPSDRYIAFVPENPQAGLVFYPGARVESEAYSLLLKTCAERNILCVLAKMPGNLAIFDPDTAGGAVELYPEVDKWYLCGHSLGGVMAASYAAQHADEFAGVILLAAYSIGDLRSSGQRVLSVYGTEDGVLNWEKYDECRSNLPADYREVIIAGGCHAYFGSYGEQSGDGKPSISREEQITQTADAITAFIIQDQA